MYAGINGNSNLYMESCEKESENNPRRIIVENVSSNVNVVIQKKSYVIEDWLYDLSSHQNSVYVLRFDSKTDDISLFSEIVSQIKEAKEKIFSNLSLSAYGI